MTVSLQSGRYSVISRKAGFVITKIPEVQVPTSEALRVVMKVDHTPMIHGLMLDGTGLDGPWIETFGGASLKRKCEI